MPDSVDSIVESFPHPTVTPIEGIPTFSSIRQLQVELNSNASSVHSNLGNGQLGLLYLTVSQATYDTISDVPFEVPQNPGPIPIIPRGTRAGAANDIRTAHAENKRVFNQYIATDKALKSQLIQAVDDLYIKTLKHRITGYANVSTSTILEHLYSAYGKMTPQDLQSLDEDMKKTYDPHMPIENLFEQIENAQDLAEAAGAPYAEAQLLNTAYTLVFQCNVFNETCREWRRLPYIDKTWPRFKTMFTEAHQDFRDTTTQGNSPYHSANAAISDNTYANDTSLPDEATHALANLAAATATDRAALSALSTTNEHLTKQLTTLTQTLTTALAKIQLLESSVSSQPRCTTLSNYDQKLFRPYCWSHGFRVSAKHNSKNCKAPKDGHKRNATASNMLNGSKVGIDDVLQQE